MFSASEAGYGQKTEEAIRRLRSLIACGELVSGEHLRQDDIAVKIGMSRVPVREAFKTLVADGVLVHRRNHGHYVAGRSRAELQQISWIRDTCENHLAATTVLPSVQVMQQLHDLNREFRQTATSAPYEMLEADRAFHQVLWSLSPLQLVAQEADRMWHMLGPYWQLMEFTQATTERMCDEHQDIITAIVDGDLTRYAEKIERHHFYLREVLERMGEA